MGNKTPIDETAVRLGTSLRSARNNCQLSIDAAAVLLHIMPMELVEYECGFAQIPTDILQRITTMGYKMLQARRFDRRYIRLRKMMVKMRLDRKNNNNE